MIIDISHYHPISNWRAAKENCSFIISKATQGTNFIDSTLKSFISGCEANGIPYWLYTYLNKGNEKAQAEFMVKTCKPLVGKHFIGYILDVEAGNTAAGVKQALDYINGLGVKTMLYTMYADFNAYKDVIANRGNNCCWWEARYGVNDGSYNSKYPCHNGVDLHQFSSKKICTFAAGCVDVNRLTGTKSLSWFTTLNVTPVIATPTIKNGSKGDQVRILQKNLNQAINAGLVVDGIAGAKTVAAIKVFQKKYGLSVDGIYGSKSYTKMKSVIK